MEDTVLPAGFHDLLYEQATQQRHAINTLLSTFRSFGYNEVYPPLVEYEASLFHGAGQALSGKTFRLMDPLSHKMMGLRADMTMQVARIAATRLKNAPKPLRLSYAGQVLQVKSKELQAHRQQYQTGIELIGVNSAKADAEVVRVIVEALDSLGIEGVYVDFSIPQLASLVLESLGFAQDISGELLYALDRKDMAAIRRLSGDKSAMLMALAEPTITIEALLAMELPHAAMQQCQRVSKVMEAIKQHAPHVSLSVDPVESLKFSYHTDIGFSIFAQGVQEELGNGGAYCIEEGLDAVGFTLYVNRLLGTMAPFKAMETVLIDGTISEQEAKVLREQGKQTIYEL